MQLRNNTPPAEKVNWFNGRDEIVIYAASILVGTIGAFFGYRLLDHYSYNAGKNLAGVFLPPLLTIAYFSYVGFRYGLNTSVLVKTCLLYCVLVMPYSPLFLQSFRPTGEDDFARYYLYAKNMFDNHTLWGGDKLFFKDAGYHYVTQPGYRYFIYLELLLFRDLYRYVSFINIGLYVLAVYYFNKAVYLAVESRKYQLCIVVLVLLLSPYIIKNLLMGLPEWLTVTLLMTICYLYVIPRNRLLSIFLLGLVPFLRQNLLIAAICLFGWILLNNRKKAVMVILFMLPLLLPVYHNLYYAKEWRFFVDVFQLPFLTYDNTQSTSGINYSLILSNVIHYTGFDYDTGRLIFSPLAAVFLPFATVMFFQFILVLPTLKEKIFFILTTMSAVAPIILFGNAYYPRFEVVNVAVMIATFVLICTHVVGKTGASIARR